MHNEIVSFINKEVSGANATTEAVEVGDQTVFVNSTLIKEVCHALKNSTEYDFNVLQVITGCDYEDRIEVSYILASFNKNTELILKTKLSKPESGLPKIESVVSIWKAAEFQERECYDMLGVDFVNHPDLRRILCPDDWQGYPLRKDYKVQEKYLNMDVNPEHKMNQGDHFFYKKIIEELGDEKKVNFSWPSETK